MSFNYPDIFSIENADQFVCRVSLYAMNDINSFMYINVIPENNPRNYFVISFDHVRYFSGPMYWTGARFEKASQIQCYSILRKITGFENYPEEFQKSRDYAGIYNLYVAGTSELPVNIIASNAEIHQASEIGVMVSQKMQNRPSDETS